MRLCLTGTMLCVLDTRITCYVLRTTYGVASKLEISFFLNPEKNGQEFWQYLQLNLIRPTDLNIWYIKLKLKTIARRLWHNWRCKLFRNASVHQNKCIVTKENTVTVSWILFVHHNSAELNAFTILLISYISLLFTKKAHHDMSYRHIYFFFLFFLLSC